MILKKARPRDVRSIVERAVAAAQTNKQKRDEQKARLADMPVEERNAWRRERIFNWSSQLWHLPKNDKERKIVEKRKKRHEAYKNVAKPVPLTPEEEVAAAMAGWPQCVLCAGRMKPHPARYLMVCAPCRKTKRECGVCLRPVRYRGAQWTTTQSGQLAALCWSCVTKHSLVAMWNPQGALDTHKRRWQSQELRVNGLVLRTSRDPYDDTDEDEQ